MLHRVLKSAPYRPFSLTLLLIALGSPLLAQDSSSTRGTEGGASALWIFANLSFTGMRAQARGGTFWKVVSFLFGFPGTLLTLFLVKPGSERAYGIDMPRRSRLE